jgi:hypothetical protein
MQDEMAEFSLSGANNGLPEVRHIGGLLWRGGRRMSLLLTATMVAVAVGVGVVVDLLLRNEERRVRRGVVGGGVVELPLCGRRLPGILLCTKYKKVGKTRRRKKGVPFAEIFKLT